MLNASRTGILLRSPIGLKTGTDLDVFFRLKPPAQVECLCRVVRSEMREEGALVGVRILSWKIDSKADLPKVVALKFADTHHRASGLATVPR